MTWLKAKVLLALIAVIWLAHIVICAPIQMPLTIAAHWTKNPRLLKISYGVWIVQDQSVNVWAHLFMFRPANPDITVSSKLGYMSEQGSKTAQAIARVVDWLFYVAIGQENHCRASIEYDEKHLEGSV